MVAVALVAGLYLWFHQSVAAVQAHSEDAKEAQTLPREPPRAGACRDRARDRLRPPRERGERTRRRARTRSCCCAPTRRTHTVSMMSFPRDMIVNVHCPGQPVFSGKINSAYANCGSKGTVQTVSDLIGLPINYLITVNFRGFKQIVNTLGGVWIDVDRRYFNDNAGLSPTFGYAKINLQPGYQKLTGGSALDYVRYRHTDSDLFRVARQQQFVKAMKYQLAHNFSLLKMPKIVGALTQEHRGRGGRRRRRLAARRSSATRSSPTHLPPGPLLPDADPGPDRLLRPAHRLVEHRRGRAGVGDTRTSTRRRTRPASRSAGRPKLKTPTPRGDDDHRPERQRRRGLGRRTPATRSPSAATTSSRRRRTRPATRRASTTSTRRSTGTRRVKRVEGGGEVGREAVRAGRRRDRCRRRSRRSRTARC